VTRTLTSLALLLVFVFAGGSGWSRTTPDSFADLAEKVVPAVVNISTTQKVQASRRDREVPIPQFPPGSPFEEFFKDFMDRMDRDRDRGNSQPQQRATSLGSGFVIDPSGYVVTNNHVIADADEIMVIFHDNQRLKAELVARDQKTDLALLKVKSEKPLTSVKWGNSDQIRVGDWVMAVGNPFGLGGTVTIGVLSARGRFIAPDSYVDFLQTDAPINRGNSGGPLFNLQGEVVGVNSAIYSPTGGSVGIGFAIPSQLASRITLQLQKFGRTKRGWLGVQIQTVEDEIATDLGLDKSRGALVSSVVDESPAAKAGILRRDVILGFDGKPVSQMRDLPRLVADTEVDRTVKVELWRKGKRMTVDVKIGELKEDETEKQASPRPERNTNRPSDGAEVLGMSLARMTPELRKRFEIQDQVNGVVVTAVKPDSPAASAGLRQGDVLVEVGEDNVATPAQVAESIGKVAKSDKKTVLLGVNRGGETAFRALRVNPG